MPRRALPCQEARAVFVASYGAVWQRRFKWLQQPPGGISGDQEEQMRQREHQSTEDQQSYSSVFGY